MKRVIASRRMVEEIKRILSALLKPEDYEVGVEDDWVFVFINLPERALGLKDLNIMADELSRGLNVDKACFSIFLAEPKGETDRIEFSFTLPYPRRLSNSDILSKYISIESDWRDYFPPPDVEFVVESYGKHYTVSRDDYNRVFKGVSKWFKDHPDLKVGDIVLFQDVRTLKSIRKFPESYDYLLTVCLREQVPKWVSPER